MENAEKKYIIADCEFRFKNLTIGMKRKADMIVPLFGCMLLELVSIVNKCETEYVDISSNETLDYKGLTETAEKVNILTEKVFAKAEELFKIILEPINPENKSVLIADNLTEDLIGQIMNDYLCLQKGQPNG